MIWIDYTLLALLVMSGGMGLIRGFRVEVYATFVWLVGVLAGLFFSKEFALFLNDYISQPVLKIAIAFVSLLGITLMLGNLIGYLLGEALTRTDILGRLVGVLMGAVRGLLIISLLVMLAGLSSLPSEAWWHEAQLIAPFQKIVLRVRDQLPTDLSRYINYQ